MTEKEKLFDPVTDFYLYNTFDRKKDGVTVVANIWWVKTAGVPFSIRVEDQSSMEILSESTDKREFEPLWHTFVITSPNLVIENLGLLSSTGGLHFSRTRAIKGIEISCPCIRIPKEKLKKSFELIRAYARLLDLPSGNHYFEDKLIEKILLTALKGGDL